jgi:hypothetical protein
MQTEAAILCSQSAPVQTGTYQQTARNNVHYRDVSKLTSITKTRAAGLSTSNLKVTTTRTATPLYVCVQDLNIGHETFSFL